MGTSALLQQLDHGVIDSAMRPRLEQKRLNGLLAEGLEHCKKFSPGIPRRTSGICN